MRNGIVLARLWLVAVVGLSLSTVLVAEGQSEGLFAAVNTGSTGPASVASASIEEFTLRTRVVTVDLDTLARIHESAVRELEGSQTLVLNLFEDTSFTGTVERTAPTFSGGYSLSGGLVEEALGAMTLVVNGELVVGTVRTLDGNYRIRSVAGGLSTISEIREPPFECHVLEPHPETGHRH